MLLRCNQKNFFFTFIPAVLQKRKMKALFEILFKGVESYLENFNKLYDETLEKSRFCATAADLKQYLPSAEIIDTSSFVARTFSIINPNMNNIPVLRLKDGKGAMMIKSKKTIRQVIIKCPGITELQLETIRNIKPAGSVFWVNDTPLNYQENGSDQPLNISNDGELTAVKSSQIAVLNSIAYSFKEVQQHLQTPHAPADAQKNSDITKMEIENKLTGEIATHEHPDENIIFEREDWLNFEQMLNS